MHSKAEGETQFVPRLQGQNIQRSALSSVFTLLVCSRHSYARRGCSPLVFVGLNRPAQTKACTQAVLDLSVSEDQQRHEEQQAVRVGMRSSIAVEHPSDLLLIVMVFFSRYYISGLTKMEKFVVPCAFSGISLRCYIPFRELGL